VREGEETKIYDGRTSWKRAEGKGRGKRRGKRKAD
jgi:hypothetical protein